MPTAIRRKAREAKIKEALLRGFFIRDWDVQSYHSVSGISYSLTHRDTIRFFLIARRLEHATGWMRTDTNGKPRRGLAQSQDEIADYCESLIRRAFDESYCNDPCKMMYFCDRKRGHRGMHREDSGLEWD